MSETRAPDSPRPPDIGRRTLSPFGYAVCVAVPILIAALGFTFLHFHYDKEDLVDGTRVPILTSGWQPGDAAQLAAFGGELTLGDDGCLRLGGEVVVWPKDYEATVQRVGPDDQLKLYDPDRDIVARSGDTIQVGGGFGEVGEYAGEPCAPESGELFFVQSEVTLADGS